MHHYTYLITYKNGMKYMGVRSCKCLPEEDNSYLGSSKHTPPKTEVVSKVILCSYPFRKEALEAEIEYHKTFNVALNDAYYNRANQTNTGFDTAGLVFQHSPEHREKIGKSLTGRVRNSEECEAISKGKKGRKRNFVATDEYRKLMSSIHKGKTVAKESIEKMVNTRKANDSFKHREETKVKISQTLLQNPPYSTEINFTKDGVTTEFKSIADCSRLTGISINTIRGRLKRGVSVVTKGWAVAYKAK